MGSRRSVNRVGFRDNLQVLRWGNDPIVRIIARATCPLKVSARRGTGSEQ
jgi:hypothetical protein